MDPNDQSNDDFADLTGAQDKETNSQETPILTPESAVEQRNVTKWQVMLTILILAAVLISLSYLLQKNSTPVIHHPFPLSPSLKRH